MFRSIRWKFIIIYFMLVFIAMIISGVFVLKFFEQYNLEIISKRLDDLSELVIPQLAEFDTLSGRGPDLQKIMKQHQSAGFREEIYVIDPVSKRVLASTTENLDATATSISNEDEYLLILKALRGERAQNTYPGLKIMSKAVPILKSGRETGVLFLRYDLKDTYETLNKSKVIIIQATLLALLITVFLSYIIAKSITEPINAVTDKAYKMARGDFNQSVDVRSDDEIGKLAEMFNHLTGKLKHSLEEMSQEQSKLETILHHMADGLVAVDASGTVLHMNSKARQLFGLAGEENPSGTFDDLAVPLSPELKLSEIMANHPEWTGNINLETQQSVYRVHFAPFSNETGEKQGMVLVFQDITEQQRLDRMRREFVANVSHELKTPLTSIKSYTETLLAGAVDEPDTARQFLTVVDHETDRMGRLVRDLLQLSNFDANVVHLDCEYHDYVDMVRKTVKKLEVTARNRGQTLEVDTIFDRMVGYFDYDRIEQVVQNIVSNALKYTPEGGVITLRLFRDEEMMLLEVEDTGIGIPESDLERIFERFYRVDKARTRNLGGTGLGLSIAKEIIQAHAGVIDIESKVEKGTKVRIRIPLEVS